MHFTELTMKALLLWYLQEFVICVLGCTGVIWREIAESSNSDVCTVKCTKDPANLPFDCQFSPELCQATVCKTHCINDSQPYQDLKNFYYEDITQTACNRGYTFVENIGLLYKKVNGLSYADAMQQCKTDGASLLLVNSRETLTYFHNLLSDSKYDYGRGTNIWGVWIDGKYDNGNWLDGTNKILKNIYWDSAAPLQPYVGTCMTFSYTQHGLLITNGDCTWRYISFCQVMI